MAAAKTERLMKLLIMLLVQRHYITKEQIRDVLYADSSAEAFERMFERDKEELRSLGVEVEVGSLDPYFDDEQGYRIRPDAAFLPEVHFTADEASVVALATKVWDHARLADATTGALRKLSAAGVETDPSALELTGPRLRADEPAFDPFLEAALARTPVSFGYRRGSEIVVETRHVQPWSVLRSSGRWYAVGFDTDRGDARVFRLSRVSGEVRPDGAPGSYDVPAGVDVRAIAARLTAPVETTEAALLVRPGTGHQLRRGATSVEPGVAGPGGGSWDRVVLSGSLSALTAEVLTHGPDVVVLEPAALRERVVARLRAAVHRASGDGAEEHA